MEASGNSELLETAVFGHLYPDTMFFDDLENDPFNSRKARIREIQISCSQLNNRTDVIKGIVVIYDDGRTVSHIGTDKEMTRQESLRLDPDESIVGVSGRYGDLIDCLTITTDKQKTLEVGGTGGSRFEFTIPDNYRVVGFRGGLGGHIHNLSLVLTSMRS